MLDVVTPYTAQSRVRVDVRSIRRTALHAHPNALEIVYVLDGNLHVRVSSEEFDLEVGDYVAINRLDPHVLDSPDGCVAAIVHLDLAAFGEVSPYAAQLMFACESFDLPRYRKQEGFLRDLILDLIDPTSACADPEALDDRAVELIRLMCEGYCIADYYQRDRPLSQAQRHKMHAISADARLHLDSKDVLEVVANAHHYSKSYVSHFIKKTSAISFSNMVTAARVMHAERLLLMTDDTVRDISALSGFSDVKYFNRCFVDWYKQTPTEYRTRNRPLMQRDESTSSVDADVTARLIEDHRRRTSWPSDPPRLSITPFVLKNVGSRADLFEKISAFSADETEQHAPEHPRRHLLPIRVGSADVRRDHLVQGLASFSRIGAVPCLVVEYTGEAGTGEMLAKLTEVLGEIGKSDVQVWLVYTRHHMREAVDRLIDAVEQSSPMQVLAMMVG